jgi:hypothetical protein
LNQTALRVVNQKPLSQVAAIRALFGLCHEKEEPEPRRRRQRHAPLARHLERLRQSNCAETPRCASRRRTTWWSRVLGNGVPPRHCDRTSPLPGCSRSCRARGARRRVIRCLLPVDLTRNSFRQLTSNKDLRIMLAENARSLCRRCQADALSPSLFTVLVERKRLLVSPFPAVCLPEELRRHCFSFC